MEQDKIHFMMVPFTGLGLYGGFRGNRWLKNRIEVFKRFVVPSLMNQTKKEFVVWITWRPQERFNPIVQELIISLEGLRGMRFVHTFGGLCFWDDKYSDEEAMERLVSNLHASLPYLHDYISDIPWVYLTIQPSDDCYASNAVELIQNQRPEHGKAFGFSRGYICNYSTKEISEYNPTTNPPFFTIVYPNKTFFEVRDHVKYIGPYKSHEYIKDHLKYYHLEGRGFCVGTHGENVSTYYDHPFKGQVVDSKTLTSFGIQDAEPIKFNVGWKRKILRILPHKIRRDARYYLGERLYKFLRS